MSFRRVFTFTVLIVLSFSQTIVSVALASDEDLVRSVKQDLDHDTLRKNGFKEFNQDKKKIDREREKGLGLFLEEQEKWDLYQQRAAREYKREKDTTPDETSPEYRADLKKKEQADEQMESFRKRYIMLKNKAYSDYQQKLAVTDEDELELKETRPRFEIRKRSRNKWAKTGKGFGSANSQVYVPPTPGSFGGNRGELGNDENSGIMLDRIPQPTDFNPIPADSFEDFTPAAQGDDGMFDSGFGDSPIPPPPPPPEGWDF